MAWVAVHPDNTMEVQVPEDAENAPTFTVGFWPPREAERFNMLLDRIRKPMEELDPIADQEKYAEGIGINYAVARDMAAYGIRDWSGIEVDGKEVKPSHETVEIDGRKHQKLVADSLEFLYCNRLLVAVAMKAWLFNTLSEEQKKTSGLQLPSSSSSPDTGADAATPNGKGKTRSLSATRKRAS